ASWLAWPHTDGPPSSVVLWPNNAWPIAVPSWAFSTWMVMSAIYHGKYRLPKAHVAQMRLSMPATSDYWVNDTAGDPLFVVTAEANAGLVKMLPSILQQVRLLLGKRRLTIVFDRGGYSPKLFQQIRAADFDLLTYRKGPHRPIPQKCFHEY